MLHFRSELDEYIRSTELMQQKHIGNSLNRCFQEISITYLKIVFDIIIFFLFALCICFMKLCWDRFLLL